MAQSVTLYSTNGKPILIDSSDLDLVSQYSWWVDDRGYARHQVYKGGQIWMHRLICNTPDGLITDHINGNRSDNRLSNLRVCNQAQNRQNAAKTIKNTSGYKGVYWDKSAERWHSQIGINRKRINLGFFKDLDEAVKTYKIAAEKYHGQFAHE